MTDDQDQPTGAGRPLAEERPRLRAVEGPVSPSPGVADPPPVRLRREFKGLTVADIQRDEVARMLPGQVRSALEWIERGDLAAAERALPGQLATIVEGPGHGRRAGGVGESGHGQADGGFLERDRGLLSGTLEFAVCGTAHVRRLCSVLKILCETTDSGNLSIFIVSGNVQRYLY